MKKTTYFLGALLLITMLSCSVAIYHASAQVSYPELHSAQFIGYAPAKLEITFPHTTTIDSNVTSLSGGRFTYTEITSSPYSTMIFSLNASDIYTVIFEIQYPVPESGNLTWTLLSPGFLPQTGSAYINASTAVALTFVAELLNEQVFPSAGEIANATDAILYTQLQANNRLLEQQIAHDNATFQTEVTWMSLAIVGMGVAFTLAIALPVVRRWMLIK